MGLRLEGIKIERYRGIGEYEIENLSNWTVVTGPNSTNKSTLINAISLLGSNKMHEESDIPTVFRPARVSPGDVPLEISYQFEITTDFLDTFSDERFLELLILSLEADIERYEKRDDRYTDTIKMRLRNLESKPLRKILVDSLYDKIRELQARYPGNPSLFGAFLTQNGRLNSIESVLNTAKYLCVKMELVINSGPSFEFSLLDQNKETVVDEHLFYHWLDKTACLESIAFAFAIGAVFIKSIMTPSIFWDSSIIPNSALAYDGSNIIEFVEYLLAQHPDRLENIDSKFEDIFGCGIKLRKPSKGSYPEETKLIVKLGDEENWFPLEKLSDGMFRVLRILMQLESSKTGDMLVIDEPELHLHPGANRYLREVLYNRKDGIQIVCSTHSPIYIDPKYIDSCILHRNQELPETIDSRHIDTALNELGSSGLDALLYDIVVWHEGPSDEFYIGKWITLFQDKINASISSIGLIHFGGKNNLGHIKARTIKNIARKSIVVIDSDKKCENMQLAGDLQSKIDQLEALGIHCWVTQRKEIENYIPINVLKVVLHIDDDSFAIGKYDDVFDKIHSAGRSCENIELARAIVDKITYGDVNSDEDFLNEIKVNLIDPLNELVN